MGRAVGKDGEDGAKAHLLALACDNGTNIDKVVARWDVPRVKTRGVDQRHT